MTIFSALHNHCTLCDGTSTLDEMINAAIGAGFTDFGMSCHGVTPFDIEYSLKDEAEYVCRVRQAQLEYSGRINIALGIEQDYYAPVKHPEQYDYIIGSVHYIKCGDNYYGVDESPQQLHECIEGEFSGDVMSFVRRYYEIVQDNVERYSPDIIGHFDLITKFNEHGEFFDEYSKQYQAIALDALEKCVSFGGIFEVNTGAISRRWRTNPYPQYDLLCALREMGAKVTISADSHTKDTLTYAFDLALSTVKKAGFKSIIQWQNGKFIETEI